MNADCYKIWFCVVEIHKKNFECLCRNIFEPNSIHTRTRWNASANIFQVFWSSLKIWIMFIYVTEKKTQLFWCLMLMDIRFDWMNWKRTLRISFAKTRSSGKNTEKSSSLIGALGYTRDCLGNILVIETKKLEISNTQISNWYCVCKFKHNKLSGS